MRCCAYILNLAVGDGLKDLNDSIIKIHDAMYVKTSPARLDKFKVCAEQEKIISKSILCLDVATRWNSTYMIVGDSNKISKSF